MFKINTADGLTSKVDLRDESQAREWLERLNDPAFQKTITNVTVMRNCNRRFRCPNCNRLSHLVCSNCAAAYNNIVCGAGFQYSMKRPENMEHIHYQIERIEPELESKMQGERIVCFAGQNRLTLMVHETTPGARITLLKIGDRRYNPYSER